MLSSKGKLVTNSSEGLGEAFSIELDSVRGVAALGKEVVVLLLEPSEEKHDVLLVRHVFSRRSVRYHIDKIAFKVAHMWQDVVRCPIDRTACYFLISQAALIAHHRAIFELSSLDLEEVLPVEQHDSVGHVPLLRYG